MSNTVFTNGGAAVDAAWLNDVNFVIYDLLGNGSLVPASRPELVTNIGATGGGGGGGSGNVTSQGETAPTSPVVGDLWERPSTGLMSRWNGTSWVVFGDIAKPDAAAAAAEAATALAAATSAGTAATAANTALAAIASDNVLSAGEKSAVILDYQNIIAEQTGIDNQATAFVVTTEKTAYDGAITTLTTYLTTLTTPTLWNDVSGNTTIVGPTFRTNFANVYAARQTLLNRIAAVAKAIADSGVANAATAAAAAAAAATAAANAQTTANAAATNATTALNQLTNIASDNILSAGEKSAVILDYTNLTTEQADIDAKASAYAITTQKANYDAALAALITYLGTLTTPTAWNDLSGDTTIVGTTFRTNFAAVYSTRQLLLNEIARVAGTVATWAGVSGVAVTTAQLVSGAATETFYDFHDFAAATFGNTTARTVTITPGANGFLEFSASCTVKPNDGDGGAGVRWLITPSDSSGAFYAQASSQVANTSSFTSITALDAWAVTGGVTYQIDFQTTKGGYASVALGKYMLRIAVVKR